MLPYCKILLLNKQGQLCKKRYSILLLQNSLMSITHEIKVISCSLVRIIIKKISCSLYNAA